MFTDEVYPNSPLIEVVFEIRFPPELAVEGRRHEFWEKVRDVYPSLLVPTGSPGQLLSLIPYRFEQEDNQAGIMMAINRFSLYVRKYEGFRKFKEEFLRMHRLFGETFSLDRVTRIGLRYINLIPFGREDGLIPLNRFLTLGFQWPPVIPERFKNLSLTFISRIDGGTITTKLEPVVRDDGREALLLDFDYSKEREGLVFTQVDTYMDEARAFIRQLFEALITDEYRQYLKGDTL